MNPSSADMAGRQAYDLLRRRFRGASASTKRRRLRAAALVARMIWNRWHVGIRRWRQKHVRWYLSHALRDASPHTAYQHYLAVRDLISALGKEHWLLHIDGSWVRPTGESGNLKTGRPQTVQPADGIAPADI